MVVELKVPPINYNFNYNTYYILNGNSTTIIYILGKVTEFLELSNSNT